MIIRDPNGTAVRVTPDERLSVIAVTEEMMHAMVELGRAWAITGYVVAVDTNDNVVFHFKNTDTIIIDVHGIVISAAIAGLATIEFEREYSSGGTVKTLVPLKTLSGEGVSLTAYMAASITLTGTAVDVLTNRIPINTPVNMLKETDMIAIGPGDTFAIRFKADSGTPTIAMNIIFHGSEPWAD